MTVLGVGENIDTSSEVIDTLVPNMDISIKTCRRIKAIVPFRLNHCFDSWWGCLLILKLFCFLAVKQALVAIYIRIMAHMDMLLCVCDFIVKKKLKVKLNFATLLHLRLFWDQ